MRPVKNAVALERWGEANSLSELEISCCKTQRTERPRWVTPLDADDSDIEVDIDIDGDDLDPDFLLDFPDANLEMLSPLASRNRKGVVPVVELTGLFEDILRGNTLLRVEKSSKKHCEADWTRCTPRFKTMPNANNSINILLPRSSLTS